MERKYWRWTVNAKQYSVDCLVSVCAAYARVLSQDDNNAYSLLWLTVQPVWSLNVWFCKDICLSLINFTFVFNDLTLQEIILVCSRQTHMKKIIELL